MIRTRPLLPLCFLAAAHIGFAQADTLSIETRVQNLLARMSPEEKFMQLFMIPGDLDEDREKYKSGIFGLQVADTDKINDIQRFFVEESRLGIPIIPFDEALHRLARPGTTAVECAARGVRQVLSPVVNIATDPRWGRTEETYGEDPFLASEMGVAFVSAFEKKGVVATPKHFVANVGDDYMDLTGQPLFPFGFGLSYTTFVYDDLNLAAAVLPSGDSTFVSVKVTNAGFLAGDEVAQLYIRDEITSVAQPVMELKGFRRIHLRPGETKEVVFPISPEILSMLDQDLKKVVEPGDFRIMIGASSKDIRLQARLRVE